MKQKSIGTRDVLPVLQQVYTDWVRELGEQLRKALSNFLPYNEKAEGYSPNQLVEGSGEKSILNQLYKHDDDNLLTVLIFDQFEEFFFACKEPKQRCQFYEFLQECLDIPFIKVILSLREDYLHYLLECNNRLANFDVINNNILDKSILYYLGNFSSIDAKSVIQSLTGKTQLFLEPSLIDELVRDLARDLGEVRPIELQVVGTELQTEKITKLEQYQQLGPKEKLVERFLDEIVKDCGCENERAAQLVLYLLTDENNTRPLKTRAELAKDLAVEADKLDFVLEILVESGLVFRIPEYPNNRYQLVHDYLVYFIRQQRGAELLAEFEKEKEQRKLAEAKLNQVLKRRLKEAYIAGIALISLAILAVVFGLRAEYERRQAEKGQILALSASSQALFASNQELNALMEGLRAGIQLKRAYWQGSDTKIRVLAALQQAVDRVRERNRLDGHIETVWGLSFSPDNKFIATGSTDQTVKIWSQDGKLLQTLKGHTDAVTSISFSPDGWNIASASLDKTVQIWQRDQITGLFNPLPYKTLRGHEDSIYSVSFSPDKKLLATGGKDGTIKLWHKSGSLVKILKGHQGWVNWVTFSPDGKFMASASDDKTVKIWQRDGRLVKTLYGHQEGVTVVAFSPNSQLLASGSRDKTVKLWLQKHNSSKDGFDFRFNKTLQQHSSVIWTLSFSNDGEKIASGSDDKSINLWSSTGTLLKTFKGHSGGVSSVAFSLDNKLLASASYDKSVKLWNVDDGVKILRGHSSRVRSVSFSSNGNIIASGSKDKTVKLWNRNGKLLKTLRGHTDEVNSVSFSPDGNTIASASWDKTVKLWNRDGKLLKTFQGHTGVILSVNFSPDGATVATASQDATVRLWRLDGTLFKILKGHNHLVNTVNFSPDGTTIASGSDDQTVKLWNSNGRLLKTLKGHNGLVLDVNFSPDGQILAAASWDNTIKLWNRKGTLLKTLKGHIDSVSSISFSPDGQMLASSSWDGTIKLWENNGNLLHIFNGHSSAVMDVSFSPDGKTIASASDDNTVILWNLDFDLNKLLLRGCNHVLDYLNNNINVDESDRHLCDDIYNK